MTTGETVLATPYEAVVTEYTKRVESLGMGLHALNSGAFRIARIVGELPPWAIPFAQNTLQPDSSRQSEFTIEFPSRIPFRHQELSVEKVIFPYHGISVLAERLLALDPDTGQPVVLSVATLEPHGFTRVTDSKDSRHQVVVLCRVRYQTPQMANGRTKSGMEYYRVGDRSIGFPDIFSALQYRQPITPVKYILPERRK